MIPDIRKTACQMGEHLTSGKVHKESHSPFASKTYHIVAVPASKIIVKSGDDDG